MFSRFFIDRPIFAAVVSIFIVLAGLAAMRNLPIAQYPEIAPPVVTVQAVYPGASAETLEQTVAAPLENQITGVEKMIYMSSTSGSNGIVQIQVTFDIGADADQAALNVNNRVKQAEPRLPEEVRRQGVTVQKGSSAFLQVLAFYSPDGRYDNLAISNFVTLNVLDALKRVPGTTNVQIFGAKRSEEHTSELQSLAYLVCRLLLEKKKKKKRTRSISKNKEQGNSSLHSLACRKQR